MTSESVAPEFHYFCSRAHCEEGKEDHEVTVKEYNSELARKERELEGKQEELKADTDHSENQATDQEWKTAKIEEERERENHDLNTNNEGTGAATTTAADAGPAEKTPAEQPERPEATSSKKEGTKEGVGGKIDSVAATADADTDTDAGVDAIAADADAGASGVKQCGVSFDPSHSNDAAGLCSHPRCSQPGTKSCASCRTTGYCGAKCQTDDWPRHRESCEGRLHKMGKDNLLKVKGFCGRRDWFQVLRCCDLALTKLNRMVNRPLDDISVARGYKFEALEALGRCKESLEYEEDACNFGASPLFIAACKGHLTVVRKMLKEGTDMNKANDFGASPLWIAARNGHLPVVQCLVERGDDKDKANNYCATPFWIAARNGHSPVVQYLLEQGVDEGKACINDMTPLHIAADVGHLLVVQKMLEKGMDKDKAYNNSNTPLHLAAQNGHLPVVQYLVEQGADQDKADNYGMTPLHNAALYGHSAVVQYLLQQGADMNKATTNGRLPIDLATNEEIKQLIRDEKKRKQN